MSEWGSGKTNRDGEKGFEQKLNHCAVRLTFTAFDGVLSSMAGRLQQEIHKVRPFDSRQQEAFLNLLRTADHFSRARDGFLKAYKLSQSQYNVLRILRSCGEDGLACKHIAERMLTREPDMTRLLDRLQERGLVTRARHNGDRRIVKSAITKAGTKLLAGIDKPIEAFYRTALGHMSDAQLAKLVELLEMCRENH